jgi:dihydropteroate synthase
MLGIERPAVMGIVNVTPDSFSDGGRFLDPGRAVEHGLELAAAGAAILDVGGESTRPGSQPVPADDQIRRVVPVVRRLAAAALERVAISAFERVAPVAISVDTTDASVAAAALDAGATVVNDVSAGRSDPDMLPLVARSGAAYVFMHMQGTPATMQVDPRYDDVVAEVGRFLAERRAAAAEAGIPDDRLVADPGLGFGKTVAHNLALLGNLGDVARAAGVPVLVGPSRKGFIGAAGGRPGTPLPVDEREDGTLAAVVWAIEHGASMVRVHDVAPAVEAIRLMQAVAAAGPTDPDPPVSWRPPVPPVETPAGPGRGMEAAAS